ncbi:MAG TPA: tetraacyldisaccharide 4'-kinase [Chryseosolibacter sp.]
MKATSLLLFPFAVLFDAVTSVRNRLYDLALKPSASFDVPVISVGNLSVGGTGKTPMVEHLIRLLGDTHRVATLSRGYKRKTKGFRIAEDNDTAETVGDEPFQFYSKFKGRVTVTVGEERALAITNILQEFPETNVILLDDAFQHRRVKPSFQILLTVYDNLFFNDWLLPAGRLRESKTGAKRADAIVVTKCPENLQDDEMIAIQKSILQYSSRPVFFTTIRYGAPVPFGSVSGILDRNVVLVTGLANADHLRNYVSNNYTLRHHFQFEDHHRYTPAEVKDIVRVASENKAQIVTSEKDAAKLRSIEFQPELNEVLWFYLPIEIGFVKSGRDFDEMVLNAVTNA